MNDRIKVERQSHSSLPFSAPSRNGGTTIHTTRLTDARGNTFTGTGWTQDEADHAAGEKMQRIEKD